MPMTESRTTAETQRMTQLEEDAREARERFDEHRNSPQPSPTKLRKFQEACRYADARLERARANA